MRYNEFKKKLERIDAIIQGAGIDEENVEIGINDHEKRAFSIDSINLSIEVEKADPENCYILIVSE